MFTRKARTALRQKRELARQGKAKTISGLATQDFAEWEAEEARERAEQSLANSDVPELSKLFPPIF